MSQVTVISGAERRRPWTDDQKRALMAAAFAPGAKVSQVAAQADIRPSQIYRWRRDLAVSDAQLVPVVVTGRAEVPDRGGGAVDRAEGCDGACHGGCAGGTGHGDDASASPMKPVPSEVSMAL